MFPLSRETVFSCITITLSDIMQAILLEKHLGVRTRVYVLCHNVWPFRAISLAAEQKSVRSGL